MAGGESARSRGHGGHGKLPAIGPDGRSRDQEACQAWADVLQLATQSPAEAAKRIAGGTGQAIIWLTRSWMWQSDKTGREALLAQLRARARASNEYTGAANDPGDGSGQAPTDKRRLSPGRAPKPKVEALGSTGRDEVPDEGDPASQLKRGAEDEGKAASLQFNPVPQLAQKLAGRMSATVLDAILIVAAIMFRNSSEPENQSPDSIADAINARTLAASFVRALVTKEIGGLAAKAAAKDLIEALRQDGALSGSSPERAINNEKLRFWQLPLQDYVSKDALELAKEAAAERGALITSSASRFFLGTDSVMNMKGFSEFARIFSESNGNGIFILVANANYLNNAQEEDPYSIFYQLAEMLLAIQSFALLGSKSRIGNIDSHSTTSGWTEWDRFASKCCLVLKNAVFIDEEGSLVGKRQIDDFVRSKLGFQDFECIDQVPNIVPPDLQFEEGDVLSVDYPNGIDVRNALSKTWHLNIKVSPENSIGNRCAYYVIPKQEVDDGADRKRFIAGGDAFLIESDPPNESSRYERAQFAIYQAACARLGLHRKTAANGSGDDQAHRDGLRAAAVLRSKDFEVLPARVALALLLVPARELVPLHQSAKKKSGKDV
jgi:hypothetical protein